MYALSSQGDMPAAHNGSLSLPQPRRVGEVSGQEVAFVHTDIESSTELSQQDGEAFKQVCCLADLLPSDMLSASHVLSCVAVQSRTAGAVLLVTHRRLTVHFFIYLPTSMMDNVSVHVRPVNC